MMDLDGDVIVVVSPFWVICIVVTKKLRNMTYNQFVPTDRLDYLLLATCTFDCSGKNCRD